MFEASRYAEWESREDPPEVDVDALQAAYPWAREHFEDQPMDLAVLQASWLQRARELDSMPPPPPDRVHFEEDGPLYDRDPETFTDAEAITRLIEVEAGIARCHALRAQLVALIAAQRPASADRPDGRPGAAAATEDAPGDVVPEVLGVSEWLSHELQMAHPYSRTAALDLVETSLVLNGRLRATLDLLAAGRIDYPRARIMADLLGTCSVEVAHTVEAIVVPRAAGLTPGGLATAIRRALSVIDAAALRRRQARAARAADVGYYPTQDGMARLIADLPLPVAAACCDAVSRYATSQRQDGDDRPIGQIRAETLADLILRPWDTSRPAVTGEVTIHLSIPTPSSTVGTGSAAGAGSGGGGGGGPGR